MARRSGSVGMFESERPARVRVKKTTRVSTASGVLEFVEHKVYTDPTLIALIVKFNVPFREVADDE